MSYLKYKWIIRYDQGNFSYRSILDYIPILHNLIKTSLNNISSIYVNFNIKFLSNQYYSESDIDNKLIINISNLDNDIIKTDNKIVHNQSLDKINTNDVNLLYPASKSDIRWNSIELPASSIYLGSALINNNINVDVNKLVLPLKKINKDLFKYDVIGISLFEYLFDEVNDFLENLSISFTGLIAGGGPMATLLPIQTAYHLNKINLLIRGEAEIIFPKILSLLSEGNLESILQYRGYILNLPGLTILSDIDHINRPDNFKIFNYNLSFVKDYQLKYGLEINISRGCNRSCIFCSKVQGREFRKVEPEKLNKLLNDMSDRIEEINSYSAEYRTLNINDDDILQNKKYANEIFNIIIKNNFKIWGIQTSIQSFFNMSIIDNELIEMINNHELFVSGKPLIWLGTDTFLKNRGKKLSKFIPDVEDLNKLIKNFEDKKIRNIHYWISSDPDSSWDEFINEYILIDELRNKYKYFDILAHAPFLIPYSSTPLKTKLLKSLPTDQIKYKNILRSHNSEFDLYFAEKVTTKHKYLNKLLSNEKIVGSKGFFDYVKEKDGLNSFLTIYNFLKKERLEKNNDTKNQLTISTLKKNEERIENILSDY